MEVLVLSDQLVQAEEETEVVAVVVAVAVVLLFSPHISFEQTGA